LLPQADFLDGCFTAESRARTYSMLIKTADDKSKRLRLLEDLQKSPRLDVKQKDWLAKELRNTRLGMQGEKNAAHYLDNYLRTSKNFMVIHDLRVSVDGEVAQIDHLMVGRAFFILVETKTFGGDVTVNDHGEYSVQYPGERVYDIPSPLEQSRRHGNVLSKLLDLLEIRPRTGGRHRMEHVVLVDPKRAIHRPDPKKLDASFLVKADQFPAWHEKWADKNPGVLELFSTLADVRGQDTIKEWAEKIARQHRPAPVLDLPEFMKPAPEPVRTTEAPRTQSNGPSPAIEEADSAPSRRKLVCGTCGAKITYAEGKFCWNQDRRFGGSQYCREHQAAFK
jgi:hypothetical protein